MSYIIPLADFIRPTNIVTHPRKLPRPATPATLIPEDKKAPTMTGDTSGATPQLDRRAFLRGLALLAASLPLQELGRALASHTGTESEWAALLQTLGKHEGMTVYRGDPFNAGPPLAELRAAFETPTENSSSPAITPPCPRSPRTPGASKLMVWWIGRSR